MASVAALARGGDNACDLTFVRAGNGSAASEEPRADVAGVWNLWRH